VPLAPIAGIEMLFVKLNLCYLLIQNVYELYKTENIDDKSVLINWKECCIETLKTLIPCTFLNIAIDMDLFKD
jgi:hypothetical protein